MVAAQTTENQQVAQEVVAYLREVLGCTATLTLWEPANKLQFYLQNTYVFMEIEINRITCIAMIERHDGSVSAPEIRKHMDNLAERFQDTFIFVTRALPANDRRRLIEKRVQFIVPGAQMYLPSLGMDLREHFPRRSTKVEAMGPATQAMLIRQLSSPWIESLQTSDIAMGRGYSFLGKNFNYSRMTLSRSVKEMEALGLTPLVANARNELAHNRLVEFKMSSVELWEKARPHMKTPVKRKVWLSKTPSMNDYTLMVAGESALAILAEKTMLADPRVPVYAMSSEQYIHYRKSEFVREVPEYEAGCQIEVWSYEPIHIHRWAPCADVFSLILSFQDHDDPRIQQCVEELEEMVKWR